ncbi:hypothetical protein ILUMI_21412 [Ignelater luminosus]|uniref:Uncharacterized protein n=1 Tax=Ignelater luminosus TaxID=2038154 RepID=A0A8K0G3W6_IGNLU|nr:hypothetical protein ILUMI_21412 [Ignelater luminosus]
MKVEQFHKSSASQVSRNADVILSWACCLLRLAQSVARKNHLVSEGSRMLNEKENQVILSLLEKKIPEIISRCCSSIFREKIMLCSLNKGVLLIDSKAQML